MRRKTGQRDAALRPGDAGGSLRHALPGGRGRRPYAVPVSQAADEAAGTIYFHCALAGEKYEIFRDGVRRP